MLALCARFWGYSPAFSVAEMRRQNGHENTEGSDFDQLVL
jgi:hypothetical protein